MEALDDRPLPADPLSIVRCCAGQCRKEQLLTIPGNLDRDRKGASLRTLVEWLPSVQATSAPKDGNCNSRSSARSASRLLLSFIVGLQATEAIVLPSSSIT